MVYTLRSHASLAPPLLPSDRARRSETRRVVNRFGRLAGRDMRLFEAVAHVGIESGRQGPPAETIEAALRIDVRLGLLAIPAAPPGINAVSCWKSALCWSMGFPRAVLGLSEVRSRDGTPIVSGAYVLAHRFDCMKVVRFLDVASTLVCVPEPAVLADVLACVPPCPWVAVVVATVELG